MRTPEEIARDCVDIKPSPFLDAVRAAIATAQREARDAGLEEAAEVCEQLARDCQEGASESMTEYGNDAYLHRSNEAKLCARRIGALKGEAK